ncbi:MAG: TerC family protein [Sneathiella sp.]|nr:TerC family protein [Sneathiella sp.]
MEFLNVFTTPEAFIALFTLIIMEIVLGIDNLIFVSILSNRLPEHQQKMGRTVGIALALVLRLALLSLIAVIVTLTEPVFELFDHAFSWRDVIMLGGGLFLVWKATSEIHHNVDGAEEDDDGIKPVKSLFSVIIQILLLDLVFSLDSIITAVGMTDELAIMVIAVIVAVCAMMLAATPLSNFISRNPTVVMLALGFLLMIGMTLIAEGLGFHVPKGYIYAAMAFSAAIEGLNMLAKSARKKKKV